MDTLNSPPASPNSFYPPLLISVVGVFSTCTALVIYHFVLIKYCKRRTQTATPNANEAHAVSAILPTGVDQKLLETIPIIPYSSNKQQEENDDHHLFRVDQSECVVCLGELEHGEFVRLLPNCKHAFHVPCIDQWFVAHTSCPICRFPIIAAADPPVTNVVDNSSSSLPPPPLLIRAVEIPSQQNSARASVANDDDACSSYEVKGQSSYRLLKHCGSLVLPTERASSSARLITGLKRSLSLDQSSVIIDMQRENGIRDGDSSSSSSKDDLVTSSSRTRSIRHLDRVSSKLLSSFSRLRLGKNTDILPY
ncbi:hypothetical protein ACH5RR_004658 [Cinchona calisaya]|uniref:RING-type E3 ubiquitin transferase n=1 Tax=Cinchona calisaya TaxID=153742 RepID=A0ABD3AY59_9GENT